MLNFLVKVVLSPLTLLYGTVIYARNWLYDSGYLKSIEFDFPVICVGNLSMGGSGKTPHVEYLIRLLSEKFRVAILSRGYRRKTSGYLQVEVNTAFDAAGDEPVMLKKKHPYVAVAVCEDRALGLPQLLSSFPETDVIILDDGFQHRSVRAGLNILLTPFNNLFTRDHLFPSGNLREFRTAYQRAEMIIVTKCPLEIGEAQKNEIRAQIAPSKNQVLMFSFVRYGAPYLFTDTSVELSYESEYSVLLITGIATNEDLKNYLRPKVQNLYSFDFSDHHPFNRNDVERITEAFGNIESDAKVIVTTEKDAVRLEPYRQWVIEKNLPIFVQPLTVDFFKEDKALFDSEITAWLERLRHFKQNSKQNILDQ